MYLLLFPKLWTKSCFILLAVCPVFLFKHRECICENIEFHNCSYIPSNPATLLIISKIMRTNSFSTSIQILIIALLFPLLTMAQDCNGYAATKKGMKMLLTTYDKGDQQKPAGTTSYEVLGHSGNKVTGHVVSIDKKGKETVNTDYTIECTGDATITDQMAIVKNQMAANMKDPNTRTEVQGSNVVMPVVLNEGQQLPDSEIDIIIHSSITMTAKIKIHDRVVVGKETITVPAGSFDCMIVSSVMETQILGNKKVTMKSWVAKGVGVVKEETYDKKGKIEKTLLLTELSN